MQGELIEIENRDKKREKQAGESEPRRSAPVKSRSYARKRNRAALYRGLRAALSLLCVLALLLCSICYAGRVDSGLPTIGETLCSLLYGGMLRPIREEKEPTLPVQGDPVETEPPADTTEKEPTAAELFASLYDRDPRKIPEGMSAILPYDLSGEHDGILSLYNDTDLTPDLNELAGREQREAALTTETEPLVLILHTHGTEGYSEKGVNWYSETYNIPRTQDISKNVVRIGAIMADRLNEAGIPTIHCEIMHDAESYLGAYERSAATIEKILADYPSIRYVFDVHRDSVLLEDGTKTRPVTVADGKVTAQIMTVVGSDALGLWHPDWEINLEFAAKLQARLNKDHLGFARRICLRGTTYNQEMAPYSLLFEIGSCGNTLEEAENAVSILSEELIAMIKNGW